MTLFENHRRLVSPGVSTIFILASLAACAQPVQPAVTAGPETSTPTAETTESVLPPRPERPSRATNSPGNGLPATTKDQDDALASLAGSWVLNSTQDKTGNIILETGDSLASGEVTVSGQWPFATGQPVRWIYLAPGSLTLTDDGGTAVWQGHGGPTSFSGTMEGGAPAATLTRK